jgi:hypothetical protein
MHINIFWQGGDPSLKVTAKWIMVFADFDCHLLPLLKDRLRMRLLGSCFFFSSFVSGFSPFVSGFYAGISLLLS